MKKLYTILSNICSRLDESLTLNASGDLDISGEYLRNGESTLHVIPHAYAETLVSSPVPLLQQGLFNTDDIGGKYMHDSQYIYLREHISDQQNGIILVWSSYTPSTSTVNDWNWNYSFVPKWHTAFHDGGGVHMHMCNSDFATPCEKYIYVYDWYLKGYSGNSSTGTGSSGIKYTNNRYVLRQVLGF